MSDIRRYPIDGLLLTERELTEYFLGNLEADSHRKARQGAEMAPAPQVPPQPIRRAKSAIQPRIHPVSPESGGLPL